MASRASFDSWPAFVGVGRGVRRRSASSRRYIARWRA